MYFLLFLLKGYFQIFGQYFDHKISFTHSVYPPISNKNLNPVAQLSSTALYKMEINFADVLKVEIFFFPNIIKQLQKLFKWSDSVEKKGLF